VTKIAGVAIAVATTVVSAIASRPQNPVPPARTSAVPGTPPPASPSAAADAEFSRGTILAIEDARAPTFGDLQVLVRASRTADTDVKIAAIRALGRLERRDVITGLLPLLSTRATRADAANAIAQAFRGADPDRGTRPILLRPAIDALISAGTSELNAPAPNTVGAIARSLGRLPYATPEQVRVAEAFLRAALGRRVQPSGCPNAGVARALESFARINRKLATLEDETVDGLRNIVHGLDPKCADVRRNAMAALIAAQRVDGETLKAALGDVDVETRRLAVLMLAGSASLLPAEERISWIRTLFSDFSLMIRYEAVRAWARRGAATDGCAPLVDALGDSSLHVVLAALDALGEQCVDNVQITDVVASEARTPPPQGHWQREAHAFVALAKRDSSRARLSLMTFATHQVWQVRMYAARAAAIIDDTEMLETLAADPENTVAETALPTLLVKASPNAETLAIAALKRTNKTIARNVAARPYGLIRTVAKSLERAEPKRELLDALAGALERISDEQCETSRDVRLALIERIGALGSIAQERVLTPLLKDQDPAISAAVAALLTSWTGKRVVAESPKQQIMIPVDDKILDQRVRASFELDSGQRFDVAFHADAPMSRLRFLALVRRGYYNNLTFHRNVPNFVIQGGSPDANEYCGDCPFMRDEIGLAMHERGTLGISTRGRDTGDAQIFINLVDNSRLDFEYTVLGHICGKGMDVVDEIQEGDRISRVTILPPTSTCGGSP
jgi:cyclophilin family peptidyl-prolyl cis-trans isomerase/HEAT repeat protein